MDAMGISLWKKKSSVCFNFLIFSSSPPRFVVEPTNQGFISTIRTKLSIVDGGWHLGAKINDGSASLDVDLSPQVRTGLH